MFLASIDAYTLSLLLYFILRWVIGDDFWVVNLTNNFIQWFLLPVAVFLPLMLWQRQKRRSGGLAVLALIFLVSYGSLFLPYRSQAAPDDATVLTVMTYNVATDHMPSESLIEALRESGADIIALQELGVQQADDLENSLLDLYPYRVLFGLGIPGKGLLSRYPILKHDLYPLVNGRPYLEVQLDIEGEPLTVIVSHPPRPQFQGGTKIFGDVSDATSEIEMLLERASLETPTLLLGDFNLSDQSENYDLISDAGWTDAFRQVGWGFGLTFPAVYMPFPLVRIDYVWSSPHLIPLESRIGPDGGSDHLPVIAELAWLGE